MDSLTKSRHGFNTNFFCLLEVGSDEGSEVGVLGAAHLVHGGATAADAGLHDCVLWGRDDAAAVRVLLDLSRGARQIVLQGRAEATAERRGRPCGRYLGLKLSLDLF